MKGRKLVNADPPSLPASRCIYGIHPVGEWLRARPTLVRRVDYDPHPSGRATAVVNLAVAVGVPVQPCDARRLTELAGSARHQGVVAHAAPFPYADIEDVLPAAGRLLVVVDQLQDPHNLGALLRTAAATGAGAVLLPKDGCVGVTATVEAAAAGAAALIPVCRVTNVARTLRRLKEHRYWIIGLVPHDGPDVFAFDPPERVALVVGGEAGMRPLVREQCDVTLSIPMAGRIESLNASVAAGVALYALRRRLGMGG